VTMNEKRKNSLLVLEVCSPQDLDAVLLECDRKKENVQYVTLILDDTRLLLRPFEYKRISRKKLHEKLIIEVVESLGLPLEDVEIGYQVLAEDKKRTAGLLWGMSRKALNEYMSVIDKYALVPLEITAYAVSRLNGFEQSEGPKAERSLLIDFSRSGNAMIAVWDQGHCPLLRILPIKNFHQLEIEVSRSIRSARAMEREKVIDRVLIQGESEHREKLIESMKEKFEIEPRTADNPEHALSLDGPVPKIKCNFAQNYSMSLPTRRNFSLALTLVTGLFILLSVIEAGRIASRQVELSSLKTQISTALGQAGIQEDAK